nr:TetR family transcriptional regulator [Nocardia sp. BMG51109]
MHAVSNRQISQAAEQGNNAAACYHFGTRADLLRAIEAKHRGEIDVLREQRLAEIGAAADLRGWVGTLVYPLTDHLADLGGPTFYARFAAQAMADPAYRDLVARDALSSPPMLRTVRGINRCLPVRPRRIRSARWMMARNLLMHTCAELEAEMAATGGPSRAGWATAAEGMIDGLVGLWQAPGSRQRRPVAAHALSTTV